MVGLGFGEEASEWRIIVIFSKWPAIGRIHIRDRYVTKIKEHVQRCKRSPFKRTYSDSGKAQAEIRGFVILKHSLARGSSLWKCSNDV